MIEGATGTAYVNGHYLPLAEACVSVLDRGFLFADGVYEVAAVIDGLLVDNDAHLARLERSAGELGIPLPLSAAEIELVQKEIVSANAMTEGLVYLQLTRGADVTRDFLAPADLAPTLILFAQVRPVTSAEKAAKGFAVKSVPDLRWARRDIKSVGLLAQALAKREAAAAGCQEAIMVEDGFVTEGASSTFHIVTDRGVLVTRPHSNAVLPGCTSAAVAALAAEQGLTVERRAFTLDEAKAAREVFITSASTFVMPVVTIDGDAVTGGVPGPLALRLRDLYLDFARRTGR
ncbi:D-amino-acid transaminase [Sphingobium aquiterrae]|uniref:D-amino-acid transaminase n=1 Tax=Sphingobium aquiterrae TaxID=2038656 RepID=UPI0030161F73